MSATLFLVRHGRTALNAQGRFRGRADPPLDERGLEEARDAGRRLASERVVAVHSSPLRRALQTAEAVAEPTDIEVMIDGRLIDLDHGSWTALTPDEAERHDPEEYATFRSSPRRAELPGGERMVDVERRMLDVLTNISLGHDGCAVAAVSHEIPIRLAIAALSASPAGPFWEIPLPTASFVEIRFEEDRLRLANDARPTTPVTWFCMACFAEIEPGSPRCRSCRRALDEDRWSYERKLIAALDHKLSDRRVLAVRILGELRSAEAIPRLVELALSGDDPILAAEAAASIAAIDPHHPLVAKLRQDGTALVRAALARTGDLGPLRRR